MKKPEQICFLANNTYHISKTSEEHVYLRKKEQIQYFYKKVQLISTNEIHITFLLRQLLNEWYLNHSIHTVYIKTCQFDFLP